MELTAGHQKVTWGKRAGEGNCDSYLAKVPVFIVPPFSILNRELKEYLLVSFEVWVGPTTSHKHLEGVYSPFGGCFH